MEVTCPMEMSRAESARLRLRQPLTPQVVQDRLRLAAGHMEVGNLEEARERAEEALQMLDRLQLLNESSSRSLGRPLTSVPDAGR